MRMCDEFDSAMVFGALSDLSGRRFALSDEGLQAADAWLRQQRV
jgi:hypothetical protein